MEPEFNENTEVQPKPRAKIAQGGRKQTQVFFDEESSDSEPEQIIVKTRKKRKPKQKKQPQVIYVSESSDSEQEEFNQSMSDLPSDPFANIRFV